MHKKLILMAVTLFAVGAVAAPTVPVTAKHIDHGTTQHCPDHNTNPKVQASGEPATADETVTVDGQEVQVVVNGKTVEFFDSEGDPIEVEFCIKAGSIENGGGAGGKQTGTSGEVTWTVGNNHRTPDISYVVVYSVVEQPEEPEEPEQPEEPETPVVETPGDVGGGLQELEAPAEAPQAQAPEAGVAAGGAISSVVAYLVALGGSVASMGYGLLRLRNFGA